MFESHFKNTLAKYIDNAEQVNKCWQEIASHYSKSKRFYHNLHHLDEIYKELTDVQTLIEDWDCITFSIAWHDIIYNVMKKDNEEKSAQLAEKKLKEFSFSQDRTAKCSEQILATKLHEESDNDTNYFTDADLAIFGADHIVYTQYAADIRKEYSIYPDMLYKPGRRKVLQHFLEMERIYKTPWFYNKYETQARINIDTELSLML